MRPRRICPGEDGLDEVVERYAAVRRFLPTFLAAFRFRTARAGDPLLGAVELLRTFYADGRTILPRRAPVSFLKPKWRRIVMPTDGAFNRRAWEIAVLVHLRDRLTSGAVWVDGSRAYRTLDDYLLPAPAFATMCTEGQLDLAVSGTAFDWIAAHRDRLRQRMGEVERAAADGTLPDAAIEDGRLTISPLRRSTPDEAEELKARLYGLLPRIRITDLLAEVSAWTGFADRFVHARTGMAASDQPALMGAILADGTNLGLARMAESSRGLTHARLLWTAEWHIRDETYAGALAAIVDHHHAHLLSRLWGPGDTSSSDGQFFRAGGRGEARADHNARYGSEPGVLFYTHVSDRFAPFHSKVIAANASEAPHVIDGLLDHESGIAIREHATDTAGAVDHVFGLCHLLGFRFAPRIRDLGERRLYAMSDLASWPTLRPLIAGSVNLRAIEEDWDETLRLASLDPGRHHPGIGDAAQARRLSTSEPRRPRPARDRTGRAHPVHARLARRCRSASPHQCQPQQGRSPQRTRPRRLLQPPGRTARPHLRERAAPRLRPQAPLPPPLQPRRDDVRWP